MPLVISDDALRAAGLDEHEAPIELACLLFDAGRMSIGHAAKFAGLTIVEFEEALHARGIPRFRYTKEMLDEDLRTMEWLGEREKQ
jgi:predicted HTH domain antitoxin